jgi:class 3 adenylate cyclase
VLPGGVPVPSAHEIARQATKAAVGLVESLTNRVAAPNQPTPAESRAAAGGRRWVAVMFTDIVGSTDLTETLGDETWMKLLGEHRSMVRACLVEHRGTEVGTQGDGFLVRFDTPGDAVACATRIQHTLAEGRRTGTFAVHVRIGIHAGEAVEGDGDLIGRVINLASRVTAAAEPGEILVTEPVADHLPPGIVLLDRGLKPLKGIAQPRHLLAVAWGEQDEAGADPTILLDEEHT